VHGVRSGFSYRGHGEPLITEHILATLRAAQPRTRKLSANYKMQ
jgi:hypothetical protein